MAALDPAPRDELARSIGSNGSTFPAQMQESESMREAFEERTAIMEFDGGLSRDEAERAAWTIILKRRRVH